MSAPNDDLNSFANLLTTAQAAYDRGDLTKALELSSQAREEDPDSEQAAVLYAFVNLSLAHGDPFSLAKGLLSFSSKGAGASQAATAPLTALKTVLGLDDAEIAELGTLDVADDDLPVIIPGCAEFERAHSKRLKYLDAGVRAVCPFVPYANRFITDDRQSCLVSKYISASPYKALFVWAFSHLSEALAFNAVLTYGSADPTGAKTNLELRVEKIQAIDTATPAGLSSFLTSVSSLSSTLDSVMPTSGYCSLQAPTSQLTATLNDLLTVDNAFGAMPGTPKKVTESISNAVLRIQNLEATAATAQNGGPTQTSDSPALQAKALKGDLNSKIAAGLASKIDQLGTGSGSSAVTPEQKTQVCDAYAKIASGVGTAPALCGG